MSAGAPVPLARAQVVAGNLIPPDLAPLLPGRMRASHNVPAEAGEA